MRINLRQFAFVVGALAPALLTMPALAQDSDSLKVIGAVTIPGAALASFDISYVDPALGIYVLADRTHKAVDVIDTHNGSFSQIGAGDFQGATGNNDTSGPDGALIIEHRELWVGDGKSLVWVFDVLTGAPLTSSPIFTGGANRADELCYDPRHHLILIANDAESPSPYVTFISSTSKTVLKKIVFDGTNGTVKATNGIEQCAWNPRNGKFYLNIPEINGPGDDSAAGGVSIIDPESMKVETTVVIDQTKCAGPQGMAIGPDGQILLGCNQPSGLKHTTPADTVGNGNFSTVVINDHGNIIKTINNESGSDEVWFNPGSNHYYLARSSAGGGIQKLGSIDAESLAPDTDVTVGAAGKNAHSVAADSVTNKVFFPVPGGVPGSTLCSQGGGVDATGCVAILKGKNDRDDCVAEGSPVIRVKEDGDADFHRGQCRDDDDRDHDH